MFTVNVNLNVPDLPDDVAFANPAAWRNYWANINLQATTDAVNNTLYVENAYNNALQPLVVTQDGIDHTVPTKAMFDSLLLAYQTLNINYKALLNTLKAAGLLENSI